MAKLIACDSGKPYWAKEVMAATICSCLGRRCRCGSSRPQLTYQGQHLGLTALAVHRPPQLLRLSAGEAGRDHRHPHDLLLKQQDSERPLQNRPQRGMRIRYLLLTAATAQIPG